MPRVCTVCSNRKRSEIDAALLSGAPFRNIAQRFRLGAWSIYRHQQEHLPAHLLKARELQESENASDLIRRLRDIHKMTQAILARALTKNDGDLALKAINRLEKQLELEGRLVGELEDRGAALQKIEVHYIDKMLSASPGSPLPNAQQAIESPLCMGTAAQTRA